MKHITAGMARLERIKANIDAIQEKSGPATFRCPTCKDTGYVMGEMVLRLGHVYETVRPCGECALGKCISDRVESMERP